MRLYNAAVEDLPVAVDFTGFKHSICPICGKEFYPNDDWGFSVMIYKGKSRIGGHREKVCSWSCRKKGEKPTKLEIKKYLQIQKELQGIVSN